MNISSARALASFSTHANETQNGAFQTEPATPQQSCGGEVPVQDLAMSQAGISDLVNRETPSISEWREVVLPRGAFPATEFFVRDLIENDCPHLEWHGGENLRAWYGNQWRAHHDGKIRVLIADFNGFPIGQAAVHWHGKPTHPLVPDIQSLRVFGAFRGLGVGSLLLDGAEALARAHGFSQVSLAVGLENPRARQLYERRGYHDFGTEYDDEWHYVDARGQEHHVVERVLDMVKNLDVRN